MSGQRPGSFSEVWDGWVGDGYLVKTSYSSTCSHCQRGTDFPSMKRMTDYVDICRGCMKLICLQCVGKPCVPFEKQCEIDEAEYRLRKRLELDSWKCY